MSIDLAAFTPVASTIGGVLIGLGTALLLLGNGRIAGISGIAGGVLNGTTPDRQWRLAFLIGLVLSPAFYLLLMPLLAGGGIASATASLNIVIDTHHAQLALSGLLVGIGTGIASGCTSGHGVCGIARWSPRSLIATAAFMTTAVLVVFITRHVVGTN